jgi:hypothetical protein
MKFPLLSLPALLIGWQLFAATPDFQSFTGSWKENLAKQHNVPPSNDVMTFTVSRDGVWVSTRFTGPATQRIAFQMDGKDYPQKELPLIVAWNKSGANTWKSVFKTNGRAFTTRWVISADGKRLTGTRTQAGKNEVQTSEYTRVSGSGTDLLGSWKHTSERSNTPQKLQIETTQSGGVTVYFSNDSAFTAKLDGKEYSYTGPTILPDITVTLHPVDARNLRVTYFRNHKPIDFETWTVSSDGKTITTAEKGADTQGQSSTAVYDKQ